MPDISKLRDIGTQKIVLKHASELMGEEVWILVKRAIQIKDLEEVAGNLENNKTPEDIAKMGNKEKFREGVREIANVIVDWNVTDNGKKAEITPENVDWITSSDFMELNKILRFQPISDTKKKS